MEQKGFEKKTAAILEGYRLSPSPAVWQQVSQRIQKRKRRRFLFWLLPSLLLIGGGLLWAVRQPAAHPVKSPETTFSSVSTGNDHTKYIAPTLPTQEIQSTVPSPDNNKTKTRVQLSVGFERPESKPSGIRHRLPDADMGHPDNPITPISIPAPLPAIARAETDSMVSLSEQIQEPALNKAGELVAKSATDQDRNHPVQQQAAAMARPDTTLQNIPAVRSDPNKKHLLSLFLAPGISLLQDRGKRISQGASLEIGFRLGKRPEKGKPRISYGLTLGLYNTEGARKRSSDLLQAGGSIAGSNPGPAFNTDPADNDRRPSLVMLSLPVDLHLPIGRKGQRPTELFAGMTNGFLLGSGLPYTDPVSGLAAPDLGKHRRFQAALQAGIETGMLQKIGYPLTIGLGYRQGITGLWKNNTGMDQKLGSLMLHLAWRIGRQQPAGTR